MLPDALAREVKRLLVVRQQQLASGQKSISLRSIARSVGISHETVRIIQNGRWSGYHTTPSTLNPQELSKGGAVVLPNMMAAYVWCDECRAWVKPPCLACQIRHYVKQKRLTLAKTNGRQENDHAAR